jgi:DNA-binding response OmpR family regulator
LNLFVQNKDKIDLVLLDVVMPRRNGREAYEEMQWAKPFTPAIFISGYTADILSDKGMYGSEFDFISKPTPPGELLRKVREVLDRQKVDGDSAKEKG